MIRYPRALMDKLGVKPGSKVSVVGLDEVWFLRQLEERGAVVSHGRVRKGSALVFAGMTAPADLASGLKMMVPVALRKKR